MRSRSNIFRRRELMRLGMGEKQSHNISPARRPKLSSASLTPFYGGGETYYLKLAAVLSSQFELGAVVVNDELRQKLSAHGVEILGQAVTSASLRYLRYPIVIARLLSAIRKFRPDAVHLNGQAESYLALIPSILRLTTIATRHTPFTVRIPAYKRWLVRKNLRFIEKTVCVSSLIRQQLSPFTDIDRLKVIPNWLPEVPELRDWQAPRECDPFRLLYVGRLERLKGIEDLIEAVRSLDSVVLDVVGDGIDLDALRRKAVGLPIHFHGFKKDCASFFRNADLLVFPSYSEGLPQVPIESMSYGTPCLVSDIPAVLETTDNGRVAEVFRCGDVVDLVNKINRLRQSPDRLKALSQAGYDRVRTTYTEEQIRPMYLELFESLLQRGS